MVEASLHPAGLVTQVYQRRLAENGYTADVAQFAALAQLDECAAHWQAWQAQQEALHSKGRSSAVLGKLLRRWQKPLSLPQGVYLHGDVGRGKTFLMDCFLEAVPIKRKTRLHFHELMREVHAESLRLSGTVNPLFALARKIAQRHQLICFDEFHLNSMADAMILENLLQALHQHQVGLIMTSNFAPEALYPDCLHRERLDAAIRYLRRTMAVIAMQGRVDHRRTQVVLDANQLAVPLDLALEPIWHSLTVNNGLANATQQHDAQTTDSIVIAGRSIAILRQSGRHAWFDFDALCNTARSKTDYLELANRYDSILLQNVPQLAANQAQSARRFTLLVDVLYDRHIQLYLNTPVPFEALYLQGALAHEFPRTASRLYEMHSPAYRAGGARVVDTRLV